MKSPRVNPPLGWVCGRASGDERPICRDEGRYEGERDTCAGLTNLGWLRLNRTGVADAGLVHVSGLTKLGMLDLYRTGITHAGLVPLHVPAPSWLQS